MLEAIAFISCFEKPERAGGKGKGALDAAHWSVAGFGSRSCSCDGGDTLCAFDLGYFLFFENFEKRPMLGARGTFVGIRRSGESAVIREIRIQDLAD